MYCTDNVANRIFVVGFMLILCVPILHINRAEKSETENRTLSVMPTLQVGGKINNKFGEEFNAWFNDRFFGRNTLIRTYNNIINTLQGDRSTGGGNKDVLVGRDNWLFYKGDNSLKNYANLNTPGMEYMAAGLAYLNDINDWCKKHNKKFYYIIGPDKNKIYPEFYPTYIKKTKPDIDGMGMAFYQYIRENSNINVIYPYDELIAAKTDDDLLYYANDTHWNMRGGYVAFREMYKKIFNKELNEKNIIRDWKEGDYSGDLLTMMNLSDGSKYAKRKYKSPEFYRQIECNSTEMYSQSQGLIKCKNPNGEQRAYVFRDSFSNALSPYMKHTFSTVERIGNII